MSIHLVDATVLIALLVPDHQHHSAAESWMDGLEDADLIASDPAVEGALTRYAVRIGHSAAQVQRTLRRVHEIARWRFWPDDLPYADSDLSTVRGHRQVTNSYLASLARHHGGRLVTFDRALAARFPDVVDLIGSGHPGK
ncbi:PIN domain-containing protein [Actinomyces israelii]|uniref:PIN domain-containing protein n=1 Tax=Actinomyces israelii TaxID=1659 RepID=UPI0005BD80D5|nr:PIN domain-containing protein [Actinomyces israelii]